MASEVQVAISYDGIFTRTTLAGTDVILSTNSRVTMGIDPSKIKKIYDGILGRVFPFRIKGHPPERVIYTNLTFSGTETLRSLSVASEGSIGNGSLVKNITRSKVTTLTIENGIITDVKFEKTTVKVVLCEPTSVN